MIQSINWIYIPNSAEKLIKTIFLPKKHKLHGLISWIKVYKLHKRKNLDKCHIWTSFIKFDPTSKSRKTWFLYLTFVIRPPEYKANSHFGTIFLKKLIFLMCPYMAFLRTVGLKSDLHLNVCHIETPFINFDTIYSKFQNSLVDQFWSSLCDSAEGSSSNHWYQTPHMDINLIAQYKRISICF